MFALVPRTQTAFVEAGSLTPGPRPIFYIF